MTLKQRTIRNEVSARGIGVHAGLEIEMRLRPGLANSGVIFKRIDLPNCPEVKAELKNVGSTQLCTCLCLNDVRISTVEHLLAAIAGLGIDNLVVELDGDEVPIMDGSSYQFVFLLQAAGVVDQDNTNKTFLCIKKKVEVSQGNKYVCLQPFDGFKVDFLIDFDHPVFNDSNQFYSVDFSRSSFVKEISRARTFGFMDDVLLLRAKNLALGGDLSNSIVLDDSKIINESGLRYKNEFVRHKVLDAIGDLSLLGSSLWGGFVGKRSGHALNYLLLSKLVSDPSNYELLTADQL